MLISGFYFFTRGFLGRQRAMVQKGLIEKFSNASDLAGFLGSPGGERFMQGMTDTGSSAKRSALRSLQSGIVALFGGAGLLGAGSNGWGDESLRGVGLVVMFVGAGFLTAAGVAWKLAGSLETNRGE